MMSQKNETIKIGNRLIGKGWPVFVIAEAGVNHNGNFDLAIKLIDAAAEAGADAVKFQTFRAEQVVTSTGKMADYQKRNIGKETSQLEMIRGFELKEDWYPALIKRAKEKGIIFISTPHGGMESVDFLESLNVPAFKFGSGDLTNLPVLEYAARLKKPMLISTGMSDLAEVKEAVEAVKNAGNDQILVFHCTTDYPCAPEFVNLRVMQSFMRELGTIVGYSDHTAGCQAPALAVALGACMIEKHFTLDRNINGPDHVASTEPKEFKEMILLLKKIPQDFEKAIQIIGVTPEAAEVLMGTSEKKSLPPELQYMSVARKSIVAARDIMAGEKFSVENLAIKRPGTGLLPKHFYKIIGAVAKADIKKDELIKKEDFA
ncbi:MAG: N-acetylneuraminate synthase [Patescibacteria group bacterium]